MLRWIHALDERLHRRIETSMHRRGILYPWWIPTVSFTGQVLCALIALVQRDALWPLQWLTLALPLVLVSPVLHVVFDTWLPWWLDGIATFAAAALLMFTPVTSGIDLAPALLALVAAEALARDGVLRGSPIGLASGGLIVTVALSVGLDGYGVHLLEVLLGSVVGAMLWWQMRALTAERQASASAWDQATTAERERIAREIHDLVAHSLSVSLLQVTGARRALRDIDDADGPADTAEAVAEVDAALADAEDVGRRAMADIRRTVGALADGSTDRRPLPGAGDIAALVGEMTAAGLRVEYTEEGDPASLPAATGLGLYRIAQESLANVAKHGAGGVALASLTVMGAGSARWRVANPLPNARPRSDGRGSGIAGMAARAAQLGARLDAGPTPDGHWEIVLELGGPARRGPGREGRIELPCGRTFRKVVSP